MVYIYIKSNSKSTFNQYESLKISEFNNIHSFVTYTNTTPLPHEFIIEFSTSIDNITGISFSPIHCEVNNPVGSCCVKNFQLFYSNNGNDYKLIKEDTYDSNNNLSFSYVFDPVNIVFNPISAKYIKFQINSIYKNFKVLDSRSARSGFCNFRIYTNTKNLYIKEIDESIFNYKNNSFNKVSNYLEWKSKTKKEKIDLINESSFDNSQISEFKNEFNDFKIISNKNNISIEEE